MTIKQYAWIGVAIALFAGGFYFGTLYQRQRDADVIKNLRAALLKEERKDVKIADAGNKQVADSIANTSDAKEKSVEIRTEYVTKIVFKDRQCPALVPTTVDAINKLLEVSNATDLFVTSDSSWWLRHIGPRTYFAGGSQGSAHP